MSKWGYSRWQKMPQVKVPLRRLLIVFEDRRGLHLPLLNVTSLSFWFYNHIILRSHLVPTEVRRNERVHWGGVGVGEQLRRMNKWSFLSLLLLPVCDRMVPTTGTLFRMNLNSPNECSRHPLSLSNLSIFFHHFFFFFIFTTYFFFFPAPALL